MELKRSQIDIITKISECLKVPAGNLELNGFQMMSRTYKDNVTNGFVSIIQQLIEESTTEIAKNSCTDREIIAQVYQWIEYVLLNIVMPETNTAIIRSILYDLNCVLATRSYLVDQFCTVADAIVFHAVRDIVVYIIQSNEKCDYLNFYRWFDHLQRRTDIQKRDKSIKMLKVFV